MAWDEVVKFNKYWLQAICTAAATQVNDDTKNATRDNIKSFLSILRSWMHVFVECMYLSVKTIWIGHSYRFKPTSNKPSLNSQEKNRLWSDIYIQKIRIGHYYHLSYYFFFIIIKFWQEWSFFCFISICFSV